MSPLAAMSACAWRCQHYGDCYWQVLYSTGMVWTVFKLAPGFVLGAEQEGKT